MTSHNISYHGALNKDTKQFVRPDNGNKTDEYICPDCNRPILWCKGIKIKSYFRHKTTTDPCSYYSHPNESQIHKEAKLLFKDALEKKIPITFYRNGNCMDYCDDYFDEYEIPEITNISSIILEHSFLYKGSTKRADIAYVENGEIVCLFEVKHKHKQSEENRPSDIAWFEFDATDFVKMVNSPPKTNETIKYKIECLRDIECETCKEREKKQLEEEQKEDKLLFNYVYDKLGNNYLSPEPEEPNEIANNKKTIELFNDDYCGLKILFYANNRYFSVVAVNPIVFYNYDDIWKEYYTLMRYDNFNNNFDNITFQHYPIIEDKSFDTGFDCYYDCYCDNDDDENDNYKTLVDTNIIKTIIKFCRKYNSEIINNCVILKQQIQECKKNTITNDTIYNTELQISFVSHLKHLKTLKKLTKNGVKYYSNIYKKKWNEYWLYIRNPYTNVYLNYNTLNNNCEYFNTDKENIYIDEIIKWYYSTEKYYKF